MIDVRNQKRGLGHFPNPYPGETFYSLLARCKKRLNLQSHSLLLRLFFNRSYTPSMIGLPQYLNSFIANLPPGHALSVEKLIMEHTPLSYASHFLSCSTLENYFDTMKSKTSSSGLYITTKKNSCLYYCPECIRSQRRLFGEAYWSVLPQLPGVLICPEHMVWLEEAKIETDSSTNKKKFYTIDEVNLTEKLREVSEDNNQIQVLIHIARTAKWILNNPNYTGTPVEDLRQRYYVLLAENGYAAGASRIKNAKLVRDFKEAFSVELLSRLEVDIQQDVNRGWLHSFLLRISMNRYISPLHHILVLHFLDCPVPSFSSVPKTYKPFGDGPWKCLNPVCDYYRTFTADLTDLNYNQDWATYTAFFQCKCGYTYKRTKTFGKNKLGLELVVKYGKVFVNSLIKDWLNVLLTKKDLQAKYVISPAKLIGIAEENGLQNPREPYIHGHLRKCIKQHIPKIKLINSQNLVFICRRLWIILYQKYSDMSLYSLKIRFKCVYSWLSKNDKFWLERQDVLLSTSDSRSFHYSPYVEYDNEDELIDAIDCATQTIKNLNIPIRITRNKIAFYMNIERFTKDFLDKHNLVKNHLAEVVEDRVHFAKRRLTFYCKQRLEKGYAINITYVKSMMTNRAYKFSENVRREIIEYVLHEVSLDITDDL